MKLARLAIVVALLAAAGCSPVKADADAAPDAPTSPAGIFCTDYGQTCGFDNNFGGSPFTSIEDCIATFEEFNTARADCVTENLSFAESDPAANCPAAAGADPCDIDDTFCVQYDLICGFGNAIGGDAYTDLSDCKTRFNAYNDVRKSCVQEHLGFAEESSPEIHCPHVEGAPPCGQ